jgi:UPF0755 protein
MKLDFTNVNKKYLVLSIIFFSFAILITVGFFITRYYLSPPSTESTPINFTIQKGESLTDVATDLEKKGFIRSSLAFRLIVQISGYQNKIQAGVFQISHNLSLKELAYELSLGNTDRSITTIEGWRIEEIAEYLDKRKIVTKDQFLTAASSFDTSNYSFLPLYTDTLDQPYRKLEGYLFPDTYEIAEHSTAKDVITKMLNDFASRITESERQSATKLNFPQTLVFASIVEREAKTDPDRAIVAGILEKRFQTVGWKLESDVTVQFALGYDPVGATWWKKDLTARDLQISSPYNTRLLPGIPPTPIDSPSLSSVKAALNPTNTDYWYYLAGKDGAIHYARTIQEHNANVSKYLR